MLVIGRSAWSCPFLHSGGPVAHYYGHQLINTRSRYSLNARVETNGKTDTTFLASAVGRDVEVSRPA